MDILDFLGRAGNIRSAFRLIFFHPFSIQKWLLRIHVICVGPPAPLITVCVRICHSQFRLRTLDSQRENWTSKKDGYICNIQDSQSGINTMFAIKTRQQIDSSPKQDFQRCKSLKGIFAYKLNLVTNSNLIVVFQ